MARYTLEQAQAARQSAMDNLSNFIAERERDKAYWAQKEEEARIGEKRAIESMAKGQAENIGDEALMGASLGTSIGGFGWGTAIGGLAGGVLGAVKNYNYNKQQGKNRGEAFRDVLQDAGNLGNYIPSSMESLAGFGKQIGAERNAMLAKEPTEKGLPPRPNTGMIGDSTQGSDYWTGRQAEMRGELGYDMPDLQGSEQIFSSSMPSQGLDPEAYMSGLGESADAGEGEAAMTALLDEGAPEDIYGKSAKKKGKPNG